MDDGKNNMGDVKKKKVRNVSNISVRFHSTRGGSRQSWSVGIERRATATRSNKIWEQEMEP